MSIKQKQAARAVRAASLALDALKKIELLTESTYGMPLKTLKQLVCEIEEIATESRKECERVAKKAATEIVTVQQAPAPQKTKVIVHKRLCEVCETRVARTKVDPQPERLRKISLNHGGESQ